MICAEWEFKSVTGSAKFQIKETCWKTFIGISFVSFVMFLPLRLLILTWISESELGHINSTQITQLFCAKRFWHAWVWIVPFHSCIEIPLCVWYQMKEEKMLLIMKCIVCFNLAWQKRYLTEKTGFLFCGTHCIVSISQFLGLTDTIATPLNNPSYYNYILRFSYQSVYQFCG